MTSPSTAPNATRIGRVGLISQRLSGMLSLLLLVNSGHAEITLEHPNLEQVRRTIAAGGDIRLATDGAFHLTNTIVFTKDTVLNAGGHQVVFDEGGSVRVFEVRGGVDVTLIGLAIANGRDRLGAGLWNDGGKVHLSNCTFADNLGIPGGGGGGGPGTAGVPGYQGQPGIAGASGVTLGGNLKNAAGSVTILNSILSVFPGSTNIDGMLEDRGYNLCSDASAHWTSESSRSDLDPRLGPLGDFGGPTFTIALLPGSPAIDAGQNAFAPATDQRGVARPVGATVDIGAFELMPPLTLRRDSARALQLTGVLTPAGSYRAQTSTDLTNWVTLGTATASADGVFEFGLGLMDVRFRFYRVALP